MWVNMSLFPSSYIGICNKDSGIVAGSGYETDFPWRLQRFERSTLRKRSTEPWKGIKMTTTPNFFLNTVFHLQILRFTRMVFLSIFFVISFLSEKSQRIYRVGNKRKIFHSDIFWFFNLDIYSNHKFFARFSVRFSSAKNYLSTLGTWRALSTKYSNGKNQDWSRGWQRW